MKRIDGVCPLYELRRMREQQHLRSLIGFTLQLHFVLLVLRSALRPNNWERLMKAKLCCGRIARFATASRLLPGWRFLPAPDASHRFRKRQRRSAGPACESGFERELLEQHARRACFTRTLIDINNAGTSIDFGFSSPVGTDSFNGPAGVTTNSAADPSRNRGRRHRRSCARQSGSQGSRGRFCRSRQSIRDSKSKNLDPAKKYTLTFFGSHKFSDDDATVYSVYTDNTYYNAGQLPPASTSRRPVRPICTIATRWSRSATSRRRQATFLYVQFTGANGHTGYLNDMRIVGTIPEPSTILLVGELRRAGFRFSATLNMLDLKNHVY